MDAVLTFTDEIPQMGSRYISHRGADPARQTGGCTVLKSRCRDRVGDAQDLSLEVITLFQLFLAARCLLTSSSNCSSVSRCPEIAYHVTVTIPSVAVRTHLNHACMKHIRLDLSTGRGQLRETTHPNIAPIPLGLHPKICGNGPSGKPLRLFGSSFPAALPCVGRFSAAHWSFTTCGTGAPANSGVASTNTAAKPWILRESDRAKQLPKTGNSHGSPEIRERRSG